VAHHQLRQTDASQECRLSALIGTGNHEELLAVAIEIIADNAFVHLERETDIVEAARCAPPIRRGEGNGKAGGLSLRGQPLMKVQTADVECQLRAEHPKEAAGGIARRAAGCRELAKAS
jgi:hypothetical protein